MLKVYFTSDSRYKVDHNFVKKKIASIWEKRELPDGAISVVFVGSRKAKKLAREYLKDNEPHPVLTFPLLSKDKEFLGYARERLFGEIVICYPQVTIYAAEQDKEINKIIGQFLDHAVTILQNQLQKIGKSNF